MGKRGPKRTPTALLRLRGNEKNIRNDGEPQVTGDMPETPEILCKRALEKWTELAPLLNSIGVLTTADVDTLARYCRLWVLWDDCSKFVEENGSVYSYVNREGEQHWKPYPQVAILLQCATTLARLEADFGMTPSSRASLNLNWCKPIEKVKLPEDYQRENFSFGGAQIGGA